MKISSTQLKADLSLLTIAFLWGGTFVMVKEAVASFPVLAFLALRFSFGLAVLLVISALPRKGRRPLREVFSRSTLRYGLGAGILFFAGYAFQTAGLQFTTSGMAGFITGASVVMVPLIGALLFKERIRWGSAAGALAALGGLYLLTQSPGAAIGVGRGELLLLFCAIAFAGHIVAVGRIAEKVDEYAYGSVQIAVVAALSLVGALLWERPLPPVSGAALGAALFTGVVVTGLLLVLQVRAQRVAPPAHAAVIFSAEPVFAALFGYLFAGEALAPVQLAGAGMIFLGMIVSALANVKRREKAPA